MCAAWRSPLPRAQRPADGQDLGRWILEIQHWLSGRPKAVWVVGAAYPSFYRLSAVTLPAERVRTPRPLGPRCAAPRWQALTTTRVSSYRHPHKTGTAGAVVVRVWRKRRLLPPLPRQSRWLTVVLEITTSLFTRRPIMRTTERSTRKLQQRCRQRETLLLTYRGPSRGGCTELARRAVLRVHLSLGRVPCPLYTTQRDDLRSTGALCHCRSGNPPAARMQARGLSRARVSISISAVPGQRL